MAYEVFKPPRRRAVKRQPLGPGCKPVRVGLDGESEIFDYCVTCGVVGGTWSSQPNLHWPGCPAAKAKRTAA